MCMEIGLQIPAEGLFLKFKYTFYLIYRLAIGQIDNPLRKYDDENILPRTFGRKPRPCKISPRSVQNFFSDKATNIHSELFN